MRLRTFGVCAVLSVLGLPACDDGEPTAVPSPSTSARTPATPKTSAPDLAPTTAPLTKSPQASAAIDRSMGPTDFAMAADGSLLVTYFGPNFNSPRTAWRLYGPRDRVLGEGLRAYNVEVAGDGFILSTPRGLLHVDTAGQTPVVWQEARSRDVVAGDVFVAGLGVYRPSEHVLFPGRADPHGRVKFSDDEGRFWALDREAKRRTLVRFARPGGVWKSRDLGPAINARTIVGRGSILMVLGPSKAYVSDDAGQSWNLVTHGAQVYWGLPVFVVRPDGSAIAGDGRAGFTITTDLRNFRTATAEESADILLGGLFSRRVDGRTEISGDHQQWEPFSPEAVRRLSAD